MAFIMFVFCRHFLVFAKPLVLFVLAPKGAKDVVAPRRLVTARLLWSGISNFHVANMK
jgi:hypothetical protein